MTDWEPRLRRHRIAFVGQRVQGDMTVQLVNGHMMVRRRRPEVEGGPCHYEGGVITAWENTKQQYPKLFDDLTLIGALIALDPAEGGVKYQGHIDWVRPTDLPKQEDSNIIDAEYEVVKH
jgi:hypothetical protein